MIPRQSLPMWLLIAVILFISACSQKNSQTVKLKNLEPITQEIVYDVQIDFQEQMYDWWTYNMETSSKSMLLSAVFDKVLNEKVTIYNEKGNPVSLDEIKDRFYYKSEPLKFNNPLITNDFSFFIPITLNEIKGIRFKESWSFDKENNLIIKEVKAYAPLIADITDPKTGMVTRYIPLFWIQPGKSDKEQQVLTNLIYSNTYLDSNFSYGSLPTHLPVETREIFTESIFDKINNDKLTVLSPSYPEPPSDTLSKEDIYPDPSRINTVITISAEMPFADDTVYTFKEFGPELVSRLGFYETWYFDPESLAISKEAIGMSIDMPYIDGYNYVRGDRPLFWVINKPEAFPTATKTTNEVSNQLMNFLESDETMQ